MCCLPSERDLLSHRPRFADGLRDYYTFQNACLLRPEGAGTPASPAARVGRQKGSGHRHRHRYNARVCRSNSVVRGVVVAWGDPWELEPCVLLPPEAFEASDTPPPDATLRRRWGAPDAETRANSRAVTWRFFSSCAGWRVPPTAAELYEAVVAEAPTPRQRTVIRAWLMEATYSELLTAWIEEAYTWQGLVAAAHRVGFWRYGVCRWLNGFARRPGRA